MPAYNGHVIEWTSVQALCWNRGVYTKLLLSLCVKFQLSTSRYRMTRMFVQRTFDGKWIDQTNASRVKSETDTFLVFVYRQRLTKLGRAKVQCLLGRPRPSQQQNNCLHKWNQLRIIYLVVSLIHCLCNTIFFVSVLLIKSLFITLFLRR